MKIKLEKEVSWDYQKRQVINKYYISIDGTCKAFIQDDEYEANRIYDEFKKHTTTSSILREEEI
jgi:hypothetical protein